MAGISLSSSTTAVGSTQSEATGNWVWLADLAGRASSLDIAYGACGFATQLGLHFDSVCSLDLADVWKERGSPGPAEWTLPFPDEHFDCIALHGTLGRLAAAQPDRPAAQHDWWRLLMECRRTLRDRGCLYIAERNPRWYGRLTGREHSRAPFAAGQLRLRLREAGFDRSHCYYTAPDLDSWRVAVPATRRAVAAFESMTAEVSSSGKLRGLSARLGAHSLLFPAYFCLAYR